MVEKYSPREIEKKWQQQWADDRLYEVNEDSPKPKFYALTMLPFTSGDLHVGHWYAYVPSDVQSRFKRMNGYNVLHPMGFDAFGLPAENAAIQRGINPLTWTMQNVENMRRQFKTIGACYDWNREVITCLPDYYKWTQWFFLKFYEHGLAYRSKARVNWCPSCQTVLANEQVVDEACERCGTGTTHRDLEQWLFRTTKYADELMQHEGIDWPERIKIMQRNWVGKSTGAEISFALEHPGVAEKEIRIFTTRPDTTFGVTFMVLAPEHPLVAKLTSPERMAEVQAYVDRAHRQTEIERLSTEKEKDGVFTGAHVINRLNSERVPVWIADYVLASYGTGAVMAVPAHDERDFAFAKKYNLPIRVVISPPNWDGSELREAYIEKGLMVNSGPFNGTPSQQGIGAVADFLAGMGWGGPATTYKLRDWVISRQRFWGAPIPIMYCPHCGIVPVPEEDLPVLLPETAEFKPTGESPLKFNEKFINTTCPKCHSPAKRETDTIDGFLDNSWYYFRYCSPRDDKAAFGKEAVKYWMPVDLYTGGAEHAVGHLMYARFFTKAIRDIGLIDFGEPFTRLFNQGVITRDHKKVSKRANPVNPDEYVSELGADTMRIYLMFLGPWEQGGDWSNTGISGSSRWLNRVWNLVLEPYQHKGRDRAAQAEAKTELLRTVHQTIRKVTGDIERLRFNTMISALMELTNYLADVKEAARVSAADWKWAIEKLVLMLAPSVPHLTEELWQQTGHGYSIHNQDWPEWDEALAKDKEITLIVQVNGKLRDRITVPASITEADAKKEAMASEKVKAHLEGVTILKEIYVPGKLVNIVVK
ncbi:MAG TPA: leucine--tRNA ligase [Dehalococcoidales bacterium]|nr:leucine--tRNA ligase [Dehalococcoidales bacterium]